MEQRLLFVVFAGVILGRLWIAGNQFSSNFNKARRLLEEAGYPNGEGFPVIELVYSNEVNDQIMLEAIQEMWCSELGIKVSILKVERKVWLESLKQSNYPWMVGI